MCTLRHPSQQQPQQQQQQQSQNSLKAKIKNNVKERNLGDRLKEAKIGSLNFFSFYC